MRALDQCIFERAGGPGALQQTGEFQVWVELTGVPEESRVHSAGGCGQGWLQGWLYVSLVTVVTGQGCEHVAG